MNNNTTEIEKKTHTEKSFIVDLNNNSFDVPNGIVDTRVIQILKMLLHMLLA